MRVSTDIAALRRTHWYEYVLRFILGGAVTVLAGLIAKWYGPAIGGLFLAFPAIFPASATLIASHEKNKKAQVGLSGSERGRALAAADAAGATMGAFGLIAFAFVVWRLVSNYPASITVAAAILAWIAVACAIWAGREHVAQRLFSKVSHSRTSRTTSLADRNRRIQ